MLPDINAGWSPVDCRCLGELADLIVVLRCWRLCSFHSERRTNAQLILSDNDGRAKPLGADSTSCSSQVAGRLLSTPSANPIGHLTTSLAIVHCLVSWTAGDKALTY